MDPLENLQPLNEEDLKAIHAYWRAANYLSAGQIYLLDNALLYERLSIKHIKRRLLGHYVQPACQMAKSH